MGAARVIEPRGLRREDAARYVGVGVTKFDAWVQSGRMPKPKRVDGCVVWDRRALDSAFDDLPTEAPEGMWARHRGAAHA